MAHFARIDSDGFVTQVIVLDNRHAPDPAPQHSEPIGQAHISALGLDGEWKQTSYSHSFRKIFAGIGTRYVEEADVFIAPQPYPSWTLDVNHDWQPPTSRPNEGEWHWDESTLSWVEVVF